MSINPSASLKLNWFIVFCIEISSICLYDSQSLLCLSSNHLVCIGDKFINSQNISMAVLYVLSPFFPLQVYGIIYFMYNYSRSIIFNFLSCIKKVFLQGNVAIIIKVIYTFLPFVFLKKSQCQFSFWFFVANWTNSK